MLELVRRTVVVRYGEIALKGPATRSRMEKLLAQAIRARLEYCRIPFDSIDVLKARVLVYTRENVSAAEALSKVFGVVSASPALEISNDIDEISKLCIEIAKDAASRGVKTFAIRARRDKRYPMTSKDVERIVGQRVKDATGLSVNLDSPDLEIGIEIWIDRAFIYTSTIHGPGGLPYGAEGAVVSLFSGGMDSALASWLALKRGCIVKLLYMDPGKFWSPKARDRVTKVAKAIREWVPEPLELLVVNYENIMDRILHSVEPRLRCVVCKSCMLAIAARIAKEVGAKAVVTGESLGQVASQTLHNISVINRASLSIPVLRPLIFLDKEEIASYLRSIGLFSYAAKSVGKCKLVPRAPETRARDSDVARYLDVVSWASESAEVHEVVID